MLALLLDDVKPYPNISILQTAMARNLASNAALRALDFQDRQLKVLT